MRLSLVIFTFVVTIPLATAAPRTVQKNMGTSISISKLTPFSNTRKPVDFDALDAHIAFVKAKVRRSIANYERNTGKKYPFVTDRVEKRDHHTVLTDMNTDLWFGTVSVGTPAEDYKVVFDTGSADFFLSSVWCDWTCDGHARWDPSRSSTSVKLPRRPFYLKYEDDTSASGDLYNDTVILSGFTAISQTIGAAKRLSEGFQMPDYTADGLMGMAFESVSTYPARPIFDTLVSQGHIRPVFSFKLSDSTSESELYVGGVNTALYIGDFVFVDVTVQAMWQVKMDNIQWNGEAILSNLEAVIDTGANVVTGPIEQVSKLYRALSGTPVYSKSNYLYYGCMSSLILFPCDKMPLISFCFGGTAFPISLKTFDIGKLEKDSDICVGGVVGDGTAENIWLVGSVFLRNVYTMFDAENNAVGFARLA